MRWAFFLTESRIVKNICINLQKLISDMTEFKITKSLNYSNEIITLYSDSFSKGISQQYIDPLVLQQYIKYILENGSALLALRNEKVVGVLLCFPLKLETELPDEIKINFNVEQCIYIAELMVNEEFRGEGVGKGLMSEFIKTIDNKLFTDIFIRVWDKNLPALQLYYKMGFTVVASISQPKKNIDGNGTFEMKKFYLHKKK